MGFTRYGAPCRARQRGARGPVKAIDEITATWASLLDASASGVAINRQTIRERSAYLHLKRGSGGAL